MHGLLSGRVLNFLVENLRLGSGSRMPITPQELGRRLKLAREGRGLTQDAAAERLRLARSAIAQIELGNRSVGGLELDTLADLYGRDIRDMLADKFRDADPLAALFRANGDLTSRPETAEALVQCVKVGRELTDLERLVGLDRDVASAVRYGLPQPRSKWEAIRQGVAVAEQERRRLGLGEAPIADIAELLETQGVRTALIDLPDEVSGLMFTDREIGPFVAVNKSEHEHRLAFSFAHEYAHVLLDRDAEGTSISRASQRNTFVEVRANSFAANLLMPEAGVRGFLATMGKGSATRLYAEAPFGDEEAESFEGRVASGHEIGLHDVVLLAHHFGVSRAVALFRLRNVKLVTEREFEALSDQERQGRGSALAKHLKLAQPGRAKARQHFHQRFLGLALEAYRRDAITRRKLCELAASALGGTSKAERFVEEFAPQDSDEYAADVLIPPS